MSGLAYLIPIFPFVAFLLIVLVTWRSPRVSGYLTVLGVFASFLVALGVFVDVQTHPWTTEEPFLFTLPWITLGGLPPLPVGLMVDPLTAIMLVVVTSVSFLIQIYSQGYMAGDTGYSRYFAYMGFFTMAMLGLVLANNLLTLYIFWELVGLASFLLIGFWYHKPEAAEAARKAFVTTRLGDFGLLIGILYLWQVTGTLEFRRLAEMIAANEVAPEVLFWAGVLVFCGAAGKSAQFPLHVWLPDAMEGPTPVSALIHAATMVAAGVYLVARAYPIFLGYQADPEHLAMTPQLLVVAGIGGFTAIFAATMGLVNNDIKRVLAYSTVSQLGYMFLALGVLAPAAGMFHLFTHAFFKALLFLAAGSVIHGAGTQDLREMGGLRRYMPITFWTMLVGALSLAGIFPLAGFWSKDEVLAVAFERQPVLFVLALVTVFMTAFYMFRVVFLAFTGEHRGVAHAAAYGHAAPSGHGAPAHESPAVMTVPLIILAVPAALIGFWGAPQVGGFQRYLEGAAAHVPEMNVGLAALSTVVALLGILLAAMFYLWRTVDVRAFTEVFEPLYTLFSRRWFIDDFYGWVVNQVFFGLGDVLNWFDTRVIDGLVNGAAGTTRNLGAGLRRMQTGQVQTYAWVIFAGLIIIALALLIPYGQQPGS